MNFRIGQKVACIKRDIWRSHDNKRVDPYGPSYGEVCTIVDLTSDGYLRLAEYDRDQRDNLIPVFLYRNFRPIVERKTDISIFNEILDRETIRDPVERRKEKRVTAQPANEGKTLS